MFLELERKFCLLNCLQAQSYPVRFMPLRLLSGDREREWDLRDNNMANVCVCVCVFLHENQPCMYLLYAHICSACHAPCPFACPCLLILLHTDDGACAIPVTEPERARTKHGMARLPTWKHICQCISTCAKTAHTCKTAPGHSLQYHIWELLQSLT